MGPDFAEAASGKRAWSEGAVFVVMAGGSWRGAILITVKTVWSSTGEGY